MKTVKLKVNLTPRTQIEFEASNPKEAMEAMSAFSEIFSESACGKCKSDKIYHSVSTHGDYTYYKLRCSACNATFDFGQNKDMTSLFAKRAPREQGDAGVRGWYNWQSGDDHQQQSASQPVQRQPVPSGRRPEPQAF